MRSNVVVLLGFLGVACGPVTDPNAGANWPDAHPESKVDAGHPPGGPYPDAHPPETCSKMDIVFVIDDSGSMEQEQTNLAANFPAFAQVLEEYRNSAGRPLDYRIAVTTTGRDLRYAVDPPVPPPPFPPIDLPPIPMDEHGDNGAFRKTCGMDRPWIERSDNDVASTFACVARVGTGGPSIEMPLLALEWAFTERVSDGANTGFLREDALLAVVVLTDEDDCSRPDNDFTVPNDGCDDTTAEVIDVGHFVTFFDGLKQERGRWATAVIAGPNYCETEFGTAYEAVRLKQFVAATGENAVFSSICQADLASSLGDALATFDAACQAFPPIEQ